MNKRKVNRWLTLLALIVVVLVYFLFIYVSITSAASGLDLELCGSGQVLLSGGAASASAGVAANAFDGSTTTTWIVTETGFDWLQQIYDASYKVCVYEIIAGTNVTAPPRDWTLEAFNGSTWVVVDSQSSQSFTSGEIRSYNVVSSMVADRWRLLITENNGNASVVIAELRLYEAVTPGATFTPYPTSTPTATPTALPPTATSIPYNLYNMKVAGQLFNIWPALILALVVTIAITYARKARNL